MILYSITYRIYENSGPITQTILGYSRAKLRYRELSILGYTIDNFSPTFGVSE